MKNKISFFLVIVFILSFVFGCATYYQKNIKFQNHLLSGEIEKAENILLKDKKAEKGKNKLLFYLNRGYISWMLQNNNESIKHFTTADRIIEDQQKNIALEALTLISNPNVKPYKPEDFEIIMVNYFLALNYLLKGEYNEAIVECKRINIKLNQLNDKYKDHKNRYQRDAFAHNLMGLIYDAKKDYNNAFIAYRNAVEIYEEDYKKNFNVNIPEQLKWDLLRTAYKTGFNEDVRFYEKKFGLKYKHKTHNGGDLIIFWQNGFGPVKSEWSINFTKVPGDEGWLTLVNDDLGLNFPIYIGNKSDNEKNAFAELSLMRVAFPKYIEREPFYQSAEVIANNNNYKLELSENINDIAFKTLNDRMMRELANSLLRLATKKALEQLANSQDENLGTALSIANALTEKADTRNWQTLPYSVYYARIPLPVGQNKVNIKTYSKQNSEDHFLNFDIKKGKTIFFAFQSIESMPLKY
ncbi:MAG: hypothetical protein KAT68_05280 [Bacteroidales bacterium]|nr:hypothetical protein [Bacteroidales bacterium]